MNQAYAKFLEENDFRTGRCDYSSFCKGYPDKKYKDLICETSRGAIHMSTQDGFTSMDCPCRTDAIVKKMQSKERK